MKSFKFMNNSFTFSEKDIPSTCPYHPYVIDQGIQEMIKLKGYTVTDAFQNCIKYSVFNWFAWDESSQGDKYWLRIYQGFTEIPSNYTPKYFKSIKDKEMEESEDPYPESMFKVGDKVTIKSQYDEGCNSVDYPYSFPKEMLEKYGGETLTIKSIHFINTEFIHKKRYIEKFCYKLQTIKEDYIWSAAMFEESSLRKKVVSLKPQHKEIAFEDPKKKSYTFPVFKETNIIITKPICKF